MNRSAAFLALVFFTLLLTPGTVFAQRGSRSQGETVEIRLASPMPRNSDWGRTMDRIAAEWARATNNEVRMRVIHDGVEGGEAKMLSSMSANNIQGALFTTFGLSAICRPVMTLSVPFMIKDDAELELVLNDVLPVLEDQISRTNFVIIAWSKSGWVNVFSKEPVFVPEDLRRQKIATNPQSVELNQVFKTMGFHLVELESMDLAPKLANNMINAIYQSPAAVAPLGLQKQLKNMLEVPIAPFLGGIVLNRVTWNKISPERQQELLRLTRRIAAEFDTSMPKTVNSALAMMQRDGLTVNRVSPAQEEQWRQETYRAVPPLLGTTFDRDLYQKISEILDKSRNR